MPLSSLRACDTRRQRSAPPSAVGCVALSGFLMPAPRSAGSRLHRARLRAWTHQNELSERCATSCATTSRGARSVLPACFLRPTKFPSLRKPTHFPRARRPRTRTAERLLAGRGVAAGAPRRRARGGARTHARRQACERRAAGWRVHVPAEPPMLRKIRSFSDLD